MELSEYWPSHMQDLVEFQQIARGEQPEFGEAARAVRDAPNDFFLESLSGYGCQRWEAILGLLPAAGNTLEERRFRISTWLNRQAPFTMHVLRQQLAMLCGESGYTAELDAARYLLTVRLALESKSNYDAVSDMLERIVPANIVVDLDLMYNTHRMVGRFTHVELAAYTHEQLRNEVFS